MDKPNFNPHEKGFLLISSYLVLSTLMVASLALWLREVAFLRASENTIAQAEAFQLAESALDLAIANLEEDITYAGVADVPYAQAGNQVGVYTVNIQTPNNNDPLLKRITATGTTVARGQGMRGVATRTVTSFVRIVPRPEFEFAFFADKGITLAGSGAVVIDSYNSSLGNYNQQPPTQNADVATNAVQNAVVSLEGNATIQGDVSVGPGADPNTAIYVGPNSSISGTTGNLPASYTYETVEVPKSAVPLGDVNLSAKQTLVLDGGSYVMDSLSITGKASIQTTEPTTVYLLGNALIEGQGIVNGDSIPKNLIIYVIGSNTLRYAGTAALYAAIYAPQSHVELYGGAGAYGAVIADTYEQGGGGNFHYDEDLKNRSANERPRAVVVSWQEQNKYFS